MIKSKKHLGLFLLLFLILVEFGISKENLYTNLLRVDYLHTDETNEVNGRSIEYQIQGDEFFYLFVKLYDKKDVLFKKRILTFSINANLVSYYEKNDEKDVVVFNQFLETTNQLYYIKDGKIKINEKEKSDKIFLEELVHNLKNKINQKKFNQEIWEIELPFSPIPFVNNIRLDINCSNQEATPYFGNKTKVVTICNLSPVSKTIKSLLGNKAKNIVILEQTKPFQVVEIILGKRHFYVTNNSFITETEKISLLQEIASIKKATLLKIQSR